MTSIAASQIVPYIALIAASATIGYWIGVGSALPITRTTVIREVDVESEKAPDAPSDTRST